MISVEDLIKWCEDNAIGRSSTYPQGWIEADALKDLAYIVGRYEPLSFYYSSKLER